MINCSMGVIMQTRSYDRERARQVRTEAGLTQPEFAALLNVSPITVCRWETGVNIPHPWIVERLLDILDHLEKQNETNKIKQ